MDHPAPRSLRNATPHAQDEFLDRAMTIMETRGIPVTRICMSGCAEQHFFVDQDLITRRELLTMAGVLRGRSA